MPRVFLNVLNSRAGYLKKLIPLQYHRLNMQKNHVFFLGLVCIVVIIAAGCTSAPATSSVSQFQASPRIPFADARFISNTTLVSFLPDAPTANWANMSTSLSPSSTDGKSGEGTRASRSYMRKGGNELKIVLEDTGMANTSMYLSMMNKIQYKDAWAKANHAKIEIGTVRGNPSFIELFQEDQEGSYDEFILVNDRFLLLIQGNHCIDDRTAIENSINIDGLKALA
jgi:hypothetical protein